MCSENMKPKPATIQLNPDTKAALKLIMHPGQTWGGVVQELLDFWNAHHPSQPREPPPAH